MSIIPKDMKYCKCGCGELINARNKNGELFYKQGHSKKGRKFPGRNKSEKGKDNNAWKGGKTIDNNGYIKIRCEEHPRATKAGLYVFEHLLVMEKKIGRFIKKNECVHHINGIKSDNREENLIILTRGEHSSYHRNKELNEGKELFGRTKLENLTGNKAIKVKQ